MSIFMEILLFFVIGVILLVAFLVWQHGYFHPISLRETRECERRLLEQATKEIRDAMRIKGGGTIR